jgi:hypothetical protein
MMIMVTVHGWTFSVRLGKDEPEEESQPAPAMNDAPLVIDEHNPLGFTIPVVRSGRPESSDDRACR